MAAAHREGIMIGERAAPNAAGLAALASELDTLAGERWADSPSAIAEQEQVEASLTTAMARLRAALSGAVTADLGEPAPARSLDHLRQEVAARRSQLEQLEAIAASKRAQVGEARRREAEARQLVAAVEAAIAASDRDLLEPESEELEHEELALLEELRAIRSERERRRRQVLEKLRQAARELTGGDPELLSLARALEGACRTAAAAFGLESSGPSQGLLGRLVEAERRLAAEAALTGQREGAHLALAAELAALRAALAWAEGERAGARLWTTALEAAGRALEVDVPELDEAPADGFPESAPAELAWLDGELAGHQILLEMVSSWSAAVLQDLRDRAPGRDL